MSGKWISLLLLVHTMALKEQKFSMEPQDQTAVVGSRVTLPCRVINKSGFLQWTRDGFGLGNLSGFDRYSIIGLQEEGDYMLEIYPLLLEDNAIFRCQVGAGVGGEPPAMSREAKLSVLVPPAAPVISQGGHLFTNEGLQIQLACTSAMGKPAAKINWIDEEGNIIQDGVKNIIEPSPNQTTFTSYSTLNMTAKEKYNNKTITCQAWNTADRSYRSTQILLHIKFAPKVHMRTVGMISRPAEGQDIHLLCLASANPPDVTYRWFINNQLVLGNPTPELVITNITRNHHNSIVKCEVFNEIGRNEASETLDVSYSPRFRIKPYSVQADIGASVTLTCDVDGNPTPSIDWIHEDSARQGNILTFKWQQVVSNCSNLTVTVTQETSGRYFCRATVPGFQGIKAEATIYMKGPPTIISHRTQYGIPGDDVGLECSAFSIPKPQKVVWSFQGEEVGSNLDYSVMEEQLTEGIKSTLLIQDTQLEHFGIYNCTVYNQYGSDEVEIHLKTQKSFPLHTTIIGVIGGVVVVITLTMFFMMCQQKPKKPTDYNLDATKNLNFPRESDRSSNFSDLKLELEYSGEQTSETSSQNALEGTGLPLAGPVPLDQRYSQRFSIADFSDTGTHQKNDGQNNNGYVPFVDYTMEYSPPSSTPLPAGVSPVPDDVDPRYSAIYGNPYLRHSTSSQLPPPPTTHIGLSPPPYNVRNKINRSTKATHV